MQIVPILVAASIAGADPSPDRPPNPPLVKLPFGFPKGMENTPVVLGGRPLLVQNERSNRREDQEEAYLFIGDLVTGQETARFGKGFSFVSALVEGDELNVFASRNTRDEWTKDIHRFRSRDLKTWTEETAIAREGDEHLFNCSVSRDEGGYVMAYESNRPVQWSFRSVPPFINPEKGRLLEHPNGSIEGEASWWMDWPQKADRASDFSGQRDARGRRCEAEYRRPSATKLARKSAARAFRDL